jgi:hypothetical protein
MLNTTANNFTFFMAPAPYSIAALGQLTDIYRARSEKITRVIVASWLLAFWPELSLLLVWQQLYGVLIFWPPQQVLLQVQQQPVQFPKLAQLALSLLLCMVLLRAALRVQRLWGWVI